MKRPFMTKGEFIACAILLALVIVATVLGLMSP
jgi:hypothetical protein